MTIKLQFVASPTPQDHLIQLYSRGWPSHVDAIMDDGRLLGARLEGGVAIRPADYKTFTMKKIVEIQGANDQAFIHFLKAQLGCAYDWRAILAFADPGPSTGDEKRWFCSELIAAGLQYAGWLSPQMFEGPANLTPRDLLFLVTARP